MRIPEPPSRASTTNSTRIRVGSRLKCSARPPQTPATWRLVRLRYSLRISAMDTAFRTRRHLTSRLEAAEAGPEDQQGDAEDDGEHADDRDDGDGALAGADRHQHAEGHREDPDQGQQPLAAQLPAQDGGG